VATAVFLEVVVVDLLAVRVVMVVMVAACPNPVHPMSLLRLMSRAVSYMLL